MGLDTIATKNTCMSHTDRFLLAGVIGWPVMHSRSPMLHTHWLETHRLAGAYVPLAVTPERLQAALCALPALNFAGCNLTIPHKEAALAFVDEADDAARRIGAVSCVTVRPDGSLYGANYDGYGFIEGLLEACPDWRADTGPITVIGAGGAARAVVHALKERGAQDIRLVNRTRRRAAALAAEFGVPVQALGWEDRDAALFGTSLLVNTTSQGMIGFDALAINLDRLPLAAIVSDIVYIPRETPLLEAARARGNRTVNGLGMLLHQARPAWRAWFGVDPAVTPELRRLIEATI